MSSPPPTSPPPGLTTDTVPSNDPPADLLLQSPDDAAGAEPLLPEDSSASRPSSPDLPLTMTASLVLTNLPRDATAALADAHAHAETIGGIPASQKIVVRFKAVGSAPPLPAKRELSRVSASQKFEAVVGYLRRVLKVAEGEGVCLYVNNCFAPALDEVVGNLWRVSSER